MRARLMLSAALLAAGCAEPGVLNPAYDLSRVRRIGVWRFESNGPGSLGAEDHFNRHMMEAGFRVVERAQLDAVLKEQYLGTSGLLAPETVRKVGRILGVDALLMGSATTVAERKQVVLIPTHTKVEEPVFKIVKEQREGGQWVEVSKQVGTNVSHVKTESPYVYAIEAHAGVTAKLVDVETGEIIWAGSMAVNGADAFLALESSVYFLVRSLSKQWIKRTAPGQASGGT